MTGQEIKGGDVKNSGNIKDLTLTINKMSGDFDSLVIDNAEVFVEVGDYKSEKVLKIGNQEVVFNNAKIDIKDVKYNYNLYKDYSEARKRGTYDEYKSKSNEFRKYCFGNAKIHLDAEETKNKVTIKADCDINAKTATLNLVNNGNYIVKDNTSADKVLEFNFKTVDVKATNVDILADNKCEDAQLEVTGVEKDDLKTTSVRTYKVKNGKLVLVSSKDKKIPNLPDVNIAELPEGLEDNSNSIEVAVSTAKTDLDKADKKPTKKNDPNETLKVVDKDGKKIGKYERKANGDNKKIESNITAKDTMICAVSFYGNKEYTFVFVIDLTNANSPKIKGSIFKGKAENKTIDSPDRFAQFAGEGGKITVVTSDGANEVSVQ